jgi:hypothetical protein
MLVAADRRRIQGAPSPAADIMAYPKRRAAGRVVRLLQRA